MVSAQDIILKQNGEKLKVELVKVSTDTIYYKDFETIGAEIKYLNFSEVFSIYRTHDSKKSPHDGSSQSTSKSQKEESNQKSEGGKKSSNPKENVQEDTINSSLKVHSPKIGYFGIASGTSTPIGEFASDASAQTGITYAVNFGCRLSEKFGVAATWYATSSQTENSVFDSYSYQGFMIGPSYSIVISEKLEFDLRAMVGYSMTTISGFSINNQNINTGSKTSSTAYNMGAFYRYNQSENIAYTFSADYFTTRPEFTDLGNKVISNISLGIGIAYRLN
jgi:hypothetical protein